jgi:hypothetical protein
VLTQGQPMKRARPDRAVFTRLDAGVALLAGVLQDHGLIEREEL